MTLLTHVSKQKTQKFYFIGMKNSTIYSRFKDCVALQPDHPAIVTDNTSIIYAELDRRVDSILGKIMEQDHRYTGIVMSHGIDMIVVMLAVLKSGGAYVPAEPSLPPERIAYMMENAGVKLVITDDFCKGLSPACASLPDRSSPEAPAYILYTSGTTGRPKGVKVENHSVVNYADAFEAEFHTGPQDVMLQYSVCSFDIFVEEVFTTLLNGATLAIPSAEVTAGGMDALMRFVERHGVTQISGFPYLLADINKLPRVPPSLRLLISGGDVLRASYTNNLVGKDLLIYNTYGPSETTVCATYFRCDNARELDDGTFPVGKPIKGVKVAILDKKGHEVKPGAIGEICIYGEGVADGYINTTPEQKNFVRTSDGKRMYRSGDMGYLLSDGNIAFLRRRDRQVMIMGKRVEPDEVENVLNSSPEVEHGIVRAFIDDCGLAYLAAYFVPKRAHFSLHKIKAKLREKLTDFMIPEFFVAVREIPLNKRGKVDISALPVVLKDNCNYD